MKTREEALTYGLSFPDTYQDAPFRDANWQLIRVKRSKKVFLWTYEREGLLCLNVKVTPESRDFWRGIYDSVVPGWHQNKEHWNTIVLDGTIPDADVRKMIYESYELVTDNPTKRIYEAVKKIPKGHVATYGQVAAMAGNENIPCFRVVNSKGELSGAFAFGGANVQAERLMADGVEVEDGKVDLTRYGIK